MLQADEFVSPAPLKHGDDDAVGGGDGEEVHQGGFEGNDDGTEHDHEQQKRHCGDRCDEDRQASGDAFREVGDHCPAGEQRACVGAANGGGEDVGAQVMDEGVGVGVLWCSGRVGGEHRGVAGGVEEWCGDGGHAWVSLEGVVNAVDGDLIGRRGNVDHDHDWSVESAAEAFGEQVETFALCGLGGSVAVVGCTDAHTEHRSCDGAQRHEAEHCVTYRVAPDVVGPTSGQGAVRRFYDTGVAVNRKLVDLCSGESEEPRQQGDGGDHRDEDHQSDGDSHRRDGG